MKRRWFKTGCFASLFGAFLAAGCAGVPSPQVLQSNSALADAQTEESSPSAPPRGSPNNNLVRLARDIEGRGSVATALPLYERAAETPEAGADVLVALGDAYAKLGRDEDAANSFRRALAKEPANNSALFGLGSVLIRSGQVDKGLEMLSAAAPNLNTPEAYERLGVAHIMAEHPREALASFEQAYGMNSKDPDIATNLALAAALLGQHSRSVTLAQQTLNYPDVKPYHRRNLILVLAISGKVEEAKIVGSQSVKANELEALLERAKAISELSDPQERARALGTIRIATARNQ